MTFCICTPYPIDSEPRGPRHAYALAKAFPAHQFVLFHTEFHGQPAVSWPELKTLPNLKLVSHVIHSKRTGPVSVLLDRWESRLAQRRFSRSRQLSPTLIAPFMRGVVKKLKALGANGYYPHNAEMMAACALVRRPGDLMILDAMEFYSDMGDGQTDLQREAIRHLEANELSHYQLLCGSSPEVVEAYRETYRSIAGVGSYNCPPIEAEVTSRSSDLPLQLYWRNAVLGLSQRGLAEILDALTSLPEEITLHLQGKLAQDGGAALRQAIAERGLTERVIILPPHPPGHAVQAASAHTIGLCMERNVNRNHQLTVSNKMFDYLMAGLAVISSDLPGLSRVVRESGGGLVYQAGDANSLREAVLTLHTDRSLLASLRREARSYALREGHRDFQVNKLIEAVRPFFDSPKAAHSH